MRAVRQNTIEVIIISDAVYTKCCAVWQIPDRKLLPHSIYDMLTQISNDFQRSKIASSVGRFELLRHSALIYLHREQTKQPPHPIIALPLLEFSPALKKLIWYLHGSYFLPNYSTDVFLFCFLSTISIFLSLGLTNVRHLHWTLSLLHIISRHATYCWLSIILFLYSVFQSVSEKLHTPPL